VVKNVSGQSVNTVNKNHIDALAFPAILHQPFPLWPIGAGFSEIDKTAGDLPAIAAGISLHHLDLGGEG
jgi:hypothetical protein